MQFPKLPLVDRDLSRRHVIGVIAAVIASTIATLPGATGGSHNGPWHQVLPWLVGFGFAVFLVFSPVLLALLAIWARAVNASATLDRNSIRRAFTLFALSLAAAAAMFGGTALAVMFYDMASDRVSFSAAWEQVVLFPEQFGSFLLATGVWAIVPRIVAGPRLTPELATVAQPTRPT